MSVASGSKAPVSKGAVIKNTLGAPLLQRIESASSPDLLAGTDVTEMPPSLESGRAKSGSLTRSNTLPRNTHSTVLHTYTELEESKLARFREWMICIIIVQFDVDYGPKIEFVTPSTDLPQSEQDNIAFSAFPDTSHPNTGTQIHSFRIQSAVLPMAPLSETKDVPLLVTEDGFLYGYCTFIQQRDKSLKRGYLQRSLVFLSQHPLPALFSAVLTTSTSLFQQHAYETLETACHNISNWPSPTAGSTLELGFLASILHVELPLHIDQQQLTETSSFGEAFDPSRHILASHPPIEIPAVEVFSTILPQLWSLWECIVLSEPVFLHACSPALAAVAIWWLRDWLRPIPMAGDFRPYFTIHDPDHKRLINKSTPQPGVMIGTTNPFLHEGCKHWPHTVSIGTGATDKPPAASKASLSPGPAPGFKTTHKRYISKDRALIRELENSLRLGVSKKERLRVSNLLRQHFASRANALLVPLNRYLTSLIPTPNSSPAVLAQAPQPGKGAVPGTSLQPAVRGRATSPAPLPTQRIAPFNSSDMLASLQRYGSPLPFKSAAKRKEFYERWLRTNAFSAWLMREEDIVMRVLAERNATASA